MPVIMNQDPNATVTSLYPSVPSASLFGQVNPAGVNPPVWTGLSRPPQPGLGSGGWRVYGGGSLAPFTGSFAPTARPWFGRPLWPCLQQYLPAPAFEPWDFDPRTPEIDPMPAADADGDGIADSISGPCRSCLRATSPTSPPSGSSTTTRPST